MRHALRTVIFIGSWLLAVCLSVAHQVDAASVPVPKPKPIVEAALHLPTTPAAPPPIVATGLPVPRWVTLKAERVNVRRGPSTEQDLLWTYVKPGLPVEIIAEYDGWRRIRDESGSTGWVRAALLDGRRSVVVSGDGQTAMLSAPKADAEAIAFVEPGLLADLVQCDAQWCEVSTRGYDGFIARDRLWGVHAKDSGR